MSPKAEATIWVTVGALSIVTLAPQGAAAVAGVVALCVLWLGIGALLEKRR